MSKETSQILKGIAILFMIFFHLFNRMNFVELCEPLIYFNDKPVVFLLAGCTNPVALFLILSGYGLFKAWSKGDKNRWGRIGKLMIHFWVILLVFVFLGHFIRPDKYPGSITEILLNFSSFKSTYNGELWFLFPYLCVSILSPYFFKLVKNIKWYWVVAFTFALHLVSIYLMTRYIVRFPDAYSSLYTLLCIPLFFFNFSLGMVAAKGNLFAKLKNYFDVNRKRRLCNWFLILAVFFSGIFVHYNFFYAFILISLLSAVRYPAYIKKPLVSLGNQSMNMWMIHSWFCYHLFSDFIYSFKYPFLIFAVLVGLSYILSLGFNVICLPIERLFLTKREIKENPVL